MSANKRNAKKEKSKFALSQNRKMRKQSPLANASKSKSPKRKVRQKRRRKKNLLLKLNNKVTLNSTRINLDRKRSL